MHQVIDHIEHIHRLTRERDRDSVDGTLVEVLRGLLDARSVALQQVISTDDGPRVWTRAWIEQGWSSPRFGYRDPLSALPTLGQDAPLRAALHQHMTVRVEQSDTVMLAVPVVCEGDEPLAVLVEYPRQASADEWRERLVEGMARIYENFVSLLDASERDPLTGLLNRKSFDDTFYRATQGAPLAGSQHARRNGDAGAYWLAVIDVDHFKSVNDRFGHLIGDEVLLLMARILRNTFRQDDRIYRFGGEEFVVLMRASDTEAALAAFERLRARVEAYSFPQVGRITVSVGLTRIRAHDTPANAFERADQAVYLAKSQGRNRVCAYEVDVCSAAQSSSDAARAHEGDIELF